MTNTQDHDPFAGGDSFPSIKFATVGDTVTGQIVAAKTVEDRDIDGTVRTWPNGDPRKVIVLELDTNADGVADASLWVKGNLYTAMKEALKAAELPTVGATVKVTHHALGTPSVKGYNAPKLFTVQLKPAAADPGPFPDDSF